jgi:hypothetical protein
VETTTVVSSLSTPVWEGMSTRLLNALNRLLATLFVMSWPGWRCVSWRCSGHTDVLAEIGAVLVDLIEALITHPLHDLAT